MWTGPPIRTTQRNPARILNGCAVLRLLGIPFSSLGTPRAGTIKTVPWGKGCRIPKEKTDGVRAEGLPGQPERSLPLGTKRRAGPRIQRAAKEKEGTPGDRIRALEV